MWTRVGYGPYKRDQMCLCVGTLRLTWEIAREEIEKGFCYRPADFLKNWRKQRFIEIIGINFNHSSRVTCNW